jgi:hypothetical protein
MAKEIDSNEMNLMLTVIKCYYEMGMNQEQIARKEFISKSSVSRLIKKAIENGYVTFQINYPVESIKILEEEFHRYFEVDKVFITPSYTEDHDIRLRYTCNSASADLQKIIKDGDIISVSWGTTMDQLASLLKPNATTLLKDIFKVNTFSVSAYIQTVSEGTLPTALTLSFTPRQRAAYFLFWSAYGLKIREEDFKKATGRSLSDMFGLELALGGLLGLFKKTEEGYSLTQKASFLYHKIEQVYTTAYIDKMWNIARKVPFPQKIVLK